MLRYSYLGYLCSIQNDLEKKLSHADVFVVFAAQTLVNCVNSKMTKAETLKQMNCALALSADYFGDTL
jgi:hypothetical protein